MTCVCYRVGWHRPLHCFHAPGLRHALVFHANNVLLCKEVAGCCAWRTIQRIEGHRDFLFNACVVLLNL